MRAGFHRIEEGRVLSKQELESQSLVNEGRFPLIPSELVKKLKS